MNLSKIKNTKIFQKTKKLFTKIYNWAKKYHEPFINWANSLPFPFKVLVWIISLILWIIWTTNPLIPAWFFLPVAWQILFSQRKWIVRTTVDFSQKTVRYVERKRQKICRKTKKLWNSTMFNQCLYRQRLHSLLHIND